MYKKIGMFFCFMILVTGMTAKAEDYKSIDLKNGETAKVYLEVYGPGDYRYDVELQNGKRYFVQHVGRNTTNGGVKGITDQEKKMAEKAIDLYEKEYGPPKTDIQNSGKNPIGFLVSFLGLFFIMAPRLAWYLETAWKKERSTASSRVIKTNRIAGVILFIIGILIIY
ncbi:DUF6199 family natural product biosynthesis protein [Falsibacillus albus]|uniref:DUF6199 domain-containing protein n=1 Tax=Falsibacillus albus TaxID=2478915 RepID=A0A3L7JUK4_9BACI|nr:DUF6199 family natural product biosynthesis protein [Falsibacillus albus]RLQ93311.1 hypothetical protein D9X91_17770 [Falsibacillus albus]